MFFLGEIVKMAVSSHNLSHIASNEHMIGSATNPGWVLTGVERDVLYGPDLANSIRGVSRCSSLSDGSMHGQVSLELVSSIRENFEEQSLSNSKGRRKPSEIFMLGYLVDCHSSGMLPVP